MIQRVGEYLIEDYILWTFLYVTYMNDIWELDVSFDKEIKWEAIVIFTPLWEKKSNINIHMKFWLEINEFIRQ